MKKYFNILILLILFLVPHSIFAQSSADLQAQINTLLEQIKVLQIQLGTQLEVETTSTDSTSSAIKIEVPGSSEIPVYCRVITHNLYSGRSDSDTGGQVSQLQQFLKEEGDFDFPTITGYFGPATERAVQKWQTKRAIVSSGDAFSTGFGVFGPKTRAVLEDYCSGRIRIPSGNLHPVINSISGPSTLRVGQAGEWIINAHDPEGGNLTYFVVWGDEIIQKTALSSGQVYEERSQTAGFTHVYSSAGGFSPAFFVRDDVGQTASTFLSVSVGGITVTPKITVTSPNGGEVWSVDPNSPGGYSYHAVRWSAQNGGQVDGFIYRTGGGPTHIYCDVGVCGPQYGISFIGDASSGFSSVPIPRNIIPASDYKVRLSMSAVGADKEVAKDMSDGAFTIRNSITPTNNPPVITSASGPGSVNVGVPVTFSWIATDLDNDKLTWGVDWGDGSISVSVCVVRDTTTTLSASSIGIPVPEINSYRETHTYSKAGTYVVTATVTDCKGGSDKDSSKISVGEVISRNSPPIITSASGPSSVNVGVPATFSWNATDLDNDKLVWGVNWGDGNAYLLDCLATETRSSGDQSIYIIQAPEISTHTDTHTYSKAGTYLVTVLVIDCKGGVDSSESKISVGEVISRNSPPVITSASGPGFVNRGVPATFTWNATDLDNDKLTWGVDWGDGSVSGLGCVVSGAATLSFYPILNEVSTHTGTHIYSNIGTYVIKATVIDCKGGSDESQSKISVGIVTPVNTEPILISSPKNQTVVVNTNTRFTWTGTDKDGDVLAWDITWGDGGAVGQDCGKFTYRSPRENDSFWAEHAWSRVGIYSLKAVLSDCKGGTVTSLTTITVVSGIDGRASNDLNQIAGALEAVRLLAEQIAEDIRNLAR